MAPSSPASCLRRQKRPDGRHAIVIGFGVNVVAAPDGLPYPAVSLADLGVARDAAAVFEALSDAWVDSFSLWRDGQGVADVLRQWRALAAGIGAPVAVSRSGGVVRGIFETIDETGRLIVRADDQTLIAITAGDVHFGATASAVDLNLAGRGTTRPANEIDGTRTAHRPGRGFLIFDDGHLPARASASGALGFSMARQ